MKELSPGLLYGLGLFETMRAYKGRILYFRQHLERISKSCQLINLSFPYSPGQLKSMIEKELKISGFADTYVRLTLTQGRLDTEISVMVKKYTAPSLARYKKGFSCGISRFRQNENSLFSQLKTSSRILYELSFQEAGAKKFDEAIILNSRGHICEASRSNIFLAKGGELFTPALECGCLEGITRGVIFDLAKKYQIKVYEGKFTIRDFELIDEAFLTNSLMGVMPLTSIERKPIARGSLGKLTKFFMKEYNLCLKDGI